METHVLSGALLAMVGGVMMGSTQLPLRFVRQ
jgi:hypothetical protein